jgi:hypothetical protein
MDKVTTLRNLLTEYEHLFQRINECETNANPCMDVSMDLMDDCDFYGVDCSGAQQIYSLFFLGSSDYFPAIWIGNDNMEDIDTMPVYILDFSNNGNEEDEEGNEEEDNNNPCGNVKQYLIQILNELVACDQMTPTEVKQAIELKDKLEQLLSNKVVNKGNYRFKMAQIV